MFDNNSANLPLTNDLNQNKDYPFKKLGGEEKKLSGLKGPVEDILSGTDSLGQVNPPAIDNSTSNLNLKETITVPAMQRQSVTPTSNLNSVSANSGTVMAGPLPSKSPHSKGGVIALIILIIIILGGAGVFAYQYFKTPTQKTMPTDSTVNPAELNKDLQNLLDVIDNQKNSPVATSSDQATTSENSLINNLPADLSDTSDDDEDGLPNLMELDLGTNPDKGDSDNDGLSDQQEIEIYHTNPVNPDSDNDGYQDGAEVVSGYDPMGSGKLLP